MATIINTPGASNESSGMGFFLGAIVLIVFGVIVLYFLLPVLRGASMGAPSAQPQDQGDGGTTIQVPDKIDVNLNQGNQ